MSDSDIPETKRRRYVAESDSDDDNDTEETKQLKLKIKKEAEQLAKDKKFLRELKEDIAPGERFKTQKPLFLRDRKINLIQDIINDNNNNNFPQAEFNLVTKPAAGIKLTPFSKLVSDYESTRLPRLLETKNNPIKPIDLLFWQYYWNVNNLVFRRTISDLKPDKPINLYILRAGTRLFTMAKQKRFFLAPRMVQIMVLQNPLVEIKGSTVKYKRFIIEEYRLKRDIHIVNTSDGDHTNIVSPFDSNVDVEQFCSNSKLREIYDSTTESHNLIVDGLIYESSYYIPKLISPDQMEHVDDREKVISDLELDKPIGRRSRKIGISDPLEVYICDVSSNCELVSKYDLNTSFLIDSYYDDNMTEYINKISKKLSTYSKLRSVFGPKIKLIGSELLPLYRSAANDKLITDTILLKILGEDYDDIYPEKDIENLNKLVFRLPLEELTAAVQDVRDRFVAATS